MRFDVSAVDDVVALFAVDLVHDVVVEGGEMRDLQAVHPAVFGKVDHLEELVDVALHEHHADRQSGPLVLGKLRAHSNKESHIVGHFFKARTYPNGLVGLPEAVHGDFDDAGLPKDAFDELGLPNQGGVGVELQRARWWR